MLPPKVKDSSGMLLLLVSVGEGLGAGAGESQSAAGGGTAPRSPELPTHRVLQLQPCPRTAGVLPCTSGTKQFLVKYPSACLSP